MSGSHIERVATLIVERDEPVVATPLIENGREVVHYTVEFEMVTSATRPGSVRDALDLAGVWGDHDWDETVDALDRIRHESQPTPPIESNDL